MKKLTTKIFFAASLISQLSSCTTLSGGQEKEAVNKNHGGPVVYAAGFEKPQTAPKSREQFLRDVKSKDGLRKMKALLAVGQWKIAVTEAEQFLRNHPADAGALEVLALGHSLGKDFDRAGYYAGQLLKVNAEHAVALNILGMREVLTTGSGYGKYKTAIGYFQRSFELGHQAAGLNMAEVYLITGNAAMALPLYQQITENCNSCISAHLGQGIAAGRLGQYQLARTSFNQALKLDPASDKARYHLALVEQNGFQNPRKAEQHLETIIADSNNAAAKERAQAFLRQLKGEETIANRLAANEEAGLYRAKAVKATDVANANEEKEAQLLLIEAEDE